jgi:hypothetical protein
VTYPNSALVDDVLDESYGGQPGNAWGSPAFAWVNSVLTFLGDAYLKYTRVPYTTLVVTVQQAVAAGDAIVLYPDNGVVGGGFYAARYAASQTNLHLLGIALEPVSAGAKCRVASQGIVPARLTGLTATGSSADVGIYATTGRLRIAQGGDTVVGRVDANGNLLLYGYGLSTP